MERSLLVRIFGFPATLVHGDSMVLDRWRWLKKRLPLTANREKVLDVGCGTGAFTIGAARRGYRAVGVSWDERNQRVAATRASSCGAETASFVIGDVRNLDSMPDLDRDYDVAICLECTEHILNDKKLFQDMAARLKPGGRLLLTTPNYYYVPLDKLDRGPFMTEETGWHVRRGYTAAMLAELCRHSGFDDFDVSYCSGFLSQSVTSIWRMLSRLPGGTALAWIVTLPLRLFPALLPDRWLTRLLGWPFYSICLEAHKPRFARIPSVNC